MHLIINHLTDWAASKRIFELRLEVYEKNKHAIKACEEMGFEKIIIQMRMGA